MSSDHLPAELKKYLEILVKNERDKAEAAYGHEPVRLLLMYSGALLNWIGDYLTDTSLSWTKKSLAIDDLTLTGTDPRWNRIIIKEAEGSPARLRLLMQDPQINEMFSSAVFRPDPILVRKDNSTGKTRLKILDGMNRVIASIREDRTRIEAWIASSSGPHLPELEPHVIYDLLRAYSRGRGDRDDLIAALRFLLDTYSNTGYLLKTRFNSEWIGHTELNGIVSNFLRE